jgi:hypothetical protein
MPTPTRGLRLKVGTEMPEKRVQDEIVSTLKALMKRFSNDIAIQKEH